MLAALFAVILTFTRQHAEHAYDAAAELVRDCTPRDGGTIRSSIAANRILDLASATGADVRRDIFTAPSPTGERTFVNLYAEFRGNPTGSWTVVVSHYDTKPGSKCPGANDGASTSGLLIGLAEALVDWKTPRGNVMLVWTDGEECHNAYTDNDGLQGSKRAVEYLRRKERPVNAVIVVDMLGDRDLAIRIPANGSPALTKIALFAAKLLKMEGLVKPIAEHVKDDHVPFIQAGWKAIDLIDFSYGPGNAWWHSPEDTMDKISSASLLKSGKLVCAMLEILL